jgi:hypothetical protein
MGRQAHWTGENLKNLLTKDLDELTKLYPQFTRNHLSATKRYWSNKMERYPSEDKTPDELKQLSDAFREAGIEFTPSELAQADRAGFPRWLYKEL